MRTVRARDVRTHLAQILDEVERGETIAIARHGRPVALLVPAAERRREGLELVEAIRAFAAFHTLGGIDVQEMIEEGRR